MNIKYFDRTHSLYYPLWSPLLLLLVPLCFPNGPLSRGFDWHKSQLCKEEEQTASFAEKTGARFSLVSLQVLCRWSLGIMGLEICPCLMQCLLIKLAARHRAFQAGVVNFKTTQLLVVWKVLLKHHANHWIHFSSLFLNAKYANMLLQCPAGKSARIWGLTPLEVNCEAGGNRVLQE